MTITANQVTAARVVLMPFVVAMIYYDGLRLFAVALGTLVGITDLLDGHLARRQGPTVIGGIMDPIADKIFVAMCFFPLADLGLGPAWLAGATFTREMLVTGLRSCLAARGQRVPSVAAAQLKTWVQMIGAGLLLLVAELGDHRAIDVVVVGGSAGALIGWCAMRLRTGRSQRKLTTAVLASATVAVAWLAWGARGLELWLYVFIASITWASAVPYLDAAWRSLRGRPPLGAGFDAARTLGGVALALAAATAISTSHVPTWAILAVVCLEAALGGLDNLLALKRAATSALAWAGRLAAEVTLLVLATTMPDDASWLAGLAAAIAAGAALAAVRSVWPYLRS
jgi:CDP-diacylglycerol--glycerol-3-phosphate 3-phosphatidyltransferase